MSFFSMRSRAPRSIPLFALATCAAALGACGDDVAPPQDEQPAPSPQRAVVVAGDFGSTGVVSLVDVDAGTIAANAIAGVAGADPMIRRIDKEVFVVNRFGPTGSSVTVLDASTLEVKHQLSTGTNTNPQDVAVVGDRLYLPALDTAGVVVLQRNGLRSLIDLSDLDPDGKPDCVSAVARGTELVVVCGLLEAFAPVRDGKVVVYDTATGARRDFSLAARNPVGLLQATPADSAFAGELVIATANFAQPRSGCVVRIDVTGGVSRCAFDNAAIGGIANHLEVSAGAGALLVTGTYYDETFQLRGALRAVSLGTGAVAPEPLSPGGHAIADFAVCPDGTLVATDSLPASSGVRIYKDGVERTAAPLAIGLPPVPQNGVICY